MDKFLKTQTLPSLNLKETENLNRSIITKELESVIKYLTTKKSPGPGGFTREFYQTPKEVLTPIHLKLKNIYIKREHILIHFLRLPFL